MNLAVGRIEKKIAHFEKPENLSSVFQNGLAFLGKIGNQAYPSFPRSIHRLIQSVELKSKLKGQNNRSNKI
jgi:hypothetical protein